MPMIQSSERVIKPFTQIKTLDEKIAGELVQVRGRLHTSRAKGKQCFIVMRQQQYTIQCLLAVNDKISKQMVKFASM